MKTLIRGITRRLGYDIVRWKPPTVQRGFNAGHLPTVCTPRTVFDVGVGNGTYALYQAYPEARFILVEPLRDYEPVIDRICTEYDCRVYYNAVGRSAGRMEMYVDLDDPQKSSFQSRTRLTRREHSVIRRTVEVTTLDDILRDNPDIQTPILLKLDTEGFELDALMGATRLLECTDTVIAEVSVARRFEGGYEFEDMIQYMRERDFRLADILSIAHADEELEPHHMDIVFKRREAGSTSQT